ncbi:hypothetical protein DM02DRAFT_537067, partial [Periconia macrospinosa]
FWISQWFWATSVTTFRLSILLLYVELFRTTIFYYFSLTTAVVVSLYWVACVLTICLLCRPVAFNWDMTLNGTCGDVWAIEIFSSAFNLAIDLWVVFLPLPVIWKLQLTPQKKWGVSATFACGLCTAAVNLGRLIQTFKCPANPDLTYCVHDSSILVMTEMAGGILVASAPTLGPLFFRGVSNRHDHYRDLQDAPRTFGSEPSRRKKTLRGTLEGSLFTDNEGEGYHDETLGAFAYEGAEMGNQVEIELGSVKK